MPSNEYDSKWMRYAIDLARHAERAGEVPVGAVVVKDQRIIGEGWNQPIGNHDASAHAEIMALRAAGNKVLNYRLTDVTLYVTLEPCVMCIGALIHARIDRLVYGAADPKAGAVNGCFTLLNDKRFNHKIDVTGGVLAEECGNLLKYFFESRR